MSRVKALVARYFSVGVLCFATLLPVASAQAQLAIGSKAFTENYILAEIAAQTIEQSGEMRVVRRLGMGGTGILFEALRKGEIQLYPEYTGTIAEAILKDPNLKSAGDLQERLKTMGLVMSEPIGFNNTYALAVTREFAELYELAKISDLHSVSSAIRVGLSYEFVNRADGFNALVKRYGLDMRGPRRSLEHSLAYEAIANRQVDLIDVYSTDAKIEKLDLVVLEDDLGFFPEYQAVFLAREEFVRENPEVWMAIRHLEGTIDAETMISLNAASDLRKESFSQIAASYLGHEEGYHPAGDTITARVWRRTKEHLLLVGIALLVSMLAGVPLGVVAAKYSKLGQGVILSSSMIQTIPSLALLCFLIPMFGIGIKPALVALCLYGLLPIVMNTFIGIRGIDPRLTETAHALGLSTWRRLYLIELRLASPSILAGIKTSTIIGIGTATLAALIGAGGYGVPIITGLAMNDMNTVLIGAVPAAVLSLFAHLVFELVGRVMIPKGLQ